jgi:putative ABC transport system permease protein
MGRKGKITGFSVKIKEGENVDAVKQRLEAFRDPKDPTVRLAAQTTLEFVNNQSHLKLVRAMSWMVSIVALAIGVISMLNTMIMSVLERTHEIGILRAVGWPRIRVVSMVLGEAILLGLAAAAVGSVGADAMTHLLSQFPKVNGFIEGGVSSVVMVEGLALAAIIAIVGGTYPAIRAARLLPTEAIRHE